VKNATYWDREKIGGTAYKIPFVDTLVYRTIKDEATQHTALRAGKLDILESIRWTAVDNLKKSAPALKWSKWLSMNGTFLAMRVDEKPFQDIRVRRALNMAVNKQEIVSAYYGGNAELFAYPMHPDYYGYYEPLEKMPASVKELFTYDPGKAKKLLTEAGYPNGFTVKNYFISKSFFYPKVLTLAQEQLKKVGIIVDLQIVEHATYHENIRKNLDPFVLYGGTRITDADPWLTLFFDSREIPDPATGNKGTNFAHYKGIDDLLAKGRVERDVKKRAAIYQEAQKRLERDLVCLPISDVPNSWARNPKRVSTPFDPHYGEFSLHYSYNYPEMLKVIR
jgi:ABC-type transport system substrate-binding protein